MCETMSDDENSKILMLMQHRGFLWGPGPEIYDPVKGSYEYGPLGKLMKNNLERYMRRKFRRNGFWEVQCPLIGPEIVWEASGHVERFFDYITQCQNPKCGNVYRVDTLLEGLGYDLTAIPMDKWQDIITKEQIHCPDCESELGKVTEQNLMVTSKIGFPASEFILRPETATTTYLTFPRLYKYFRTKMPIFVFQMGHAFRNEISPRNMLLRTREFEQCEGQIFITPDQEMSFEPYEDQKNSAIVLWSAEAQENNDKKYQKVSLEQCINDDILQKPAYAWLLWLAYDIIKGLGIPDKSLRLRQHKMDERAHYAHDAWDLEIDSKIYGWTEVCGIHDRGDWDLGRHYEYSNKKSLKVPGPKKGQKQIPHILEIAFGVGRLFFFALELAFKFEEERNVLDLPVVLAPIPFAVFPLMKKPKGLKKLAKDVYGELVDNDIGVVYDESGSIGKRYRRTEEVGVRFAYTVDHQSLEDNTLTIRNIEDMSQKRINIDEIVDISTKIMRKTLTYDEIQDVEKEKTTKD
ncbi:MAG: glycine--tRNA ligase [Candidatus Lokiarchaeota archaeon]|nr:glycine--tRNA ligase [Candidatus Lokiarchaeota archaeon]